MRDYAKNIPEQRKKGDDRFVPLFFVAVVALSTLVFLATPAALGTRDTLIRFVPEKAIAYVHGGAEGAQRIVSASVSMPAGVRPREAAAFAVASEDGSIERGMLLGWDVLRGPTDAERAALAERGAVPVGPMTYVLGGGRLIAAVRSANADGRSLGNDIKVGRALSSMRSISTLQVFASSSSIKTGPLAELFGVIEGEVEPFVMGIAPTEILTTAIIVPVRVAAASYPFGFRAPSSDRAPGVILEDSFAKTIVSESRPGFDPMPLIFNSSNSTAPHVDSSSEKALLLSVLDAPMRVAFYPDPEKETVPALLHFPTLAPERISPALERYVSVSRPERRPFLMPDEDIALEFAVNPDRFHFEPLPDSPYYGALSLSMEQPSLQLILAPDGRHGSFLTADIQLLKMIGSETGNNAFSSDCPLMNSSNFISIRSPETLLSYQPAFSEVIPFISVKRIKASSIGDNVVILCGYTE